MCGLCFVTDKEIEVEELPWGPHEWLSRPGLTDAEKLLVVRVKMPAGKAHEFHRHPECEEVLYILEGQAEQWVGEKKQILKAGEVAHIPTNVVHGTYNISDSVCVFLAILSPATTKGPLLVDVSQEEPWKSIREKT